MNKIILLALFCIIMSSAWSQSEEKNVIKENPLLSIIGAGTVFYERKIDDKHSWQLGLGFMALRIGSTHISGISLTPEYRIYLKKKALSGVYVGPFLRYQNYSVSDGYKDEYTSFGGGVILGRQWIYSSGFVLDIFAGPSYNSGRTKTSSGDVTNDQQPFGIDGTSLRVGLALGFGF